MNEDATTLNAGRQSMGPALTRWGPFELRERVGHGGFGEVYRAYDSSLQREIAVKLLFPREGEWARVQEELLLREARAMARVTHSNLAPIYGVGSFEGRAGFWSAFIHGKTLSSLLDINGRFGPQETILIGIDLCRAVTAVHAAGLLHCDIKTSNVMREAGGRILLMDFGLTEQAAKPMLLGGTPGYMAPELLAGEKATVRTDVYALGVLLYHLLTACLPEPEHWSLLEQRPDLPASLVEVVHRAMHADPAQRYGSAAELASALTAAGPGTQSSVPVMAPPAKTKRPWIAIAAVLAVAAGGFAWQWRARQSAAAPAAVHTEYDKAHDLLQHYYRPGALETAIPQLEAITRKEPAFAAAWAELGRANFLQFWQLRDAKYEQPAVDASLKAVALDPNVAGAHVTLGMVYTQTDRNDLAAQELDTALKLDRLNAEAWAARSELYMRQGRADDAENAIREAIDLAPADWRWPKQLTDIYSRRGKFEQAIETSAQVINLSPDNARAYNNLGLYLTGVGRFRDAETALRKAIAIEPGYNRYTNLGKVLQEQGKPEDAEQMFRKAAELNPSDYRAWDFLAALYWDQKKDPEKTREAYRKTIELAEALRAAKPREAYLLADLGEAYAHLGDEGQALPLLRQAMALAPEDSDILRECGTAFELLRHRDEALQAISAALDNGLSITQLEKDRDLAELCKDPKLVAKIRSLR
jgi:serine/threonine-protein kinase